MAQYIDKSAVVAEIEKYISNYKGILNKVDKSSYNWLDSIMSLESKIDVLQHILSFLDTLEVKEEILDKEGKTKLMKKCVHKAYQRGYDMGVLQTANKINHNTKEVDLEKEFDNYAKDILACNVQFEPFTHLYNCAKYFYELGLAQKGE